MSSLPLRPRFLRVRVPTFVALAVALTLLIVGVNARVLFRTELFEHGDAAANSFQVRRAKHFHELYGQYSRWGFHHPGPGWFYAQAAGEALFHDTLRLVPTPLNGQLLITVALLAGFFAAAVATAARWVNSRWFVPLTLILAVLHFTAVNGATVFVLNWPAFVMVTPFLCLLVAAASVGAGRGEDLPLLVLAGGALLHAHIAQPLFVFPLWALAYAGLLRAGMARETTGDDPAPGTTTGRRVFPWRAFPRAHLGAAALAALFALPVVIDLCRGAESNFALILAHRRAHAGEHHSWLESVSYFLRFGVYRPYRESEEFYRGGTTAAELRRFFVNHPGMLGVWLAALLVFLGGWWWSRRGPTRLPGAAGADAGERGRQPAGSGATAARGRFLGWLGACWLMAVSLTLCWGVIQDGQMFYFNAWFNYAIYFALAMGAAAAGSGWLESLTAPLPIGLRRVAAGALLAVAAGMFAQRVERFRAPYGSDEASRAMVRGVTGALAAQPGEPRVRFLSFPHPAWEAAAGVALQLERLGCDFRVQPGWELIFGRDHSPASSREDSSGHGGFPALRLWRIALSAADLGEGVGPGRPLVLGCVLATDAPALDPAAAGAEVAFTGGSRTFAPFVLYGWAPPGVGAPFSFSVEKEALLGFHPQPVPADPGTAVELSFDFFPVLSPGKRERQRLELRFNDVDLGTWELGKGAEADGAPPLRVRVPAAVWNARPDVLLACRFPDAISPFEVDGSADGRPLAFGFRAIRFRVVTTPAGIP